jgi:hypothetical protein
MGYQTIDALDWSGKAWERYVIDDPAGVCPTSVQFYELDDERYLESWRRKYGGEKEGHSEQEEGANGLFDAIVFNFAINESKAVTFATELLNKDHGILLAPINTSTDYWLKQRYKVMDASGKVLWSADDVGAWSVLFQPDVTQDTVREAVCYWFHLPSPRIPVLDQCHVSSHFSNGLMHPFFRCHYAFNFVFTISVRASGAHHTMDFKRRSRMQKESTSGGIIYRYPRVHLEHCHTQPLQ